MFTCVDRDGNPLGYERDGTPVAMFFVDAARAEQELTMARTGWPESDFRVIGVGLGDVYRQALPADTRPQADTPRAACAPTRRPPLPAGRRTREGSALLVAGAAALEGGRSGGGRKRGCGAAAAPAPEADVGRAGAGW